jgi:hypothetical protein
MPRHTARLTHTKVSTRIRVCGAQQTLCSCSFVVGGPFSYTSLRARKVKQSRIGCTKNRAAVPLRLHPHLYFSPSRVFFSFLNWNHEETAMQIAINGISTDLLFFIQINILHIIMFYF